MHINI